MFDGWNNFYHDLIEQLPLVLNGIVGTFKLAAIVSLSGFLWGIIIFFSVSAVNRPLKI